MCFDHFVNVMFCIVGDIFFYNLNLFVQCFVQPGFTLVRCRHRIASAPKMVQDPFFPHLKHIAGGFSDTHTAFCELFGGVVNLTLTPAADCMDAMCLQCGAGNTQNLFLFSHRISVTQG